MKNTEIQSTLQNCVHIFYGCLTAIVFSSDETG